MKNHRKILVLILSVMMVFTLMPSAAFAGIEDGDRTEFEPELQEETLWEGAESFSSPHFANVGYEDIIRMENVTVTSSDTSVISVEYHEGSGGGIYDYILFPQSTGTAVITVTYTLDGVEYTARGTYTVKSFPVYIENLTIDGEAIDIDDYHNHEYLNIYDYEGTSPKVKFTMAEGWNFGHAYGSYRKKDSTWEEFTLGYDFPENGWTLDFGKEYAGMNVFFAFNNSEGEEIQFGIRFSKKEGEDPGDEIMLDTIEISNINTQIIPGEKAVFTAELLSENMTITNERWFKDDQMKILTSWSDDLPEEGECYYYFVTIRANEGYKFADDLTVICNGEEVDAEITVDNETDISITNIVPSATAKQPTAEMPVDFNEETGKLTWTWLPEYGPTDYELRVTYAGSGLPSDPVRTISVSSAGDTSSFRLYQEIYNMINNGQLRKSTAYHVSVSAVNEEGKVFQMWEMDDLALRDQEINDDNISLTQTVFAYTGSMISVNNYILLNNDSTTEGYWSCQYTAIGHEGQQPKYIGDVKVVITGRENSGFTGSAAKYYTIKGDLSKSATSVRVTLDADEYAYDGAPVEPTVTVKAYGKSGSIETLTEGIDYAVSYTDNNAPGTGYVVITAVEDSYYMGEKSVPFTITEASGEVYVKSIDYTAFPRLRKDVDAALSSTSFQGDTVTLNYSDGTSEKYIFDNNDHSFKSETTGEVTEESSRLGISYDSEKHMDFAYYYNGGVQLRVDAPEASYVAKAISMKQSAPVELVKGKNSVTMTDAQGNEYESYSVPRSIRFNADDEFTVTYENGVGETIDVDYVYTDSTGGFTLAEDSPYYTGYPSDNYFGNYMNVNVPDQSVDHFEVGGTYSMSVTYHESGSNYDLAPLTTTDGSYRVTIREAGPQDVTSVSFVNTDNPIRVAKGDTVQLEVKWAPEYANVPASAIQWTSSNPEVATIDENGLVTAVLTENDTNPNIIGGTTQITAQIGNRIAYKNIEVYIVTELTDENTTLMGNAAFYTGEPRTFGVRCGSKILTEGRDYEAVFSNNTYIGDASVTITGKGNYKGTVTKTFKVVGRVEDSIVQFTVEPASFDEYTYAGEPIEPKITKVTAVGKGTSEVVTLTEGVDYEVLYESNNAPGTGRVMVSGLDYYMGAKTITFNIVGASASEIDLTVVDGVLTWPLVDGAAEYGVMIAGSGWWTIWNEEGNTGSFEVNAKIDELIKAGTIQKPADGNYELTVAAFTEYMEEEITRGTLTYHYESSAEYIEPVDIELSVENGILTWSPAEGAVRYMILVDFGEKYVAGRVKAEDIGPFDIDAAIEKGINDGWLLERPDGNYTLVVQAINDDGQIIANGSLPYHYEKAAPEAGWRQDESGNWCYYNEDGTIAKNKWLKDQDGEWCYVGADGKKITNKWQKDSKGWCYLDADGKMVTNGFVPDSKGQCYIGSDGYMLEKTQWIEVDGTWYYIKNGYMAVNQWQKDGKGWMYLGSDGLPVKNVWKKDSKGWCYLGDDGYMVTNGWARDSKGWCWIAADGYMPVKTQWIQKDGKWYHITNGYRDENKWMKDSKGWCWLQEDGSMLVNGWAKDSKGTCWIASNGYMPTTTQWVKYEGQWYHITKGYRDENKWVKDSKGWCWLKEDGSMLTNGWAKDKKGQCWIGEEGYMVEETRLVEYDGHTYGIKDGYMVVNGTIEYNGAEYYFGEDGILVGAGG